MIELLLGSKNKERILLFLYGRPEGYAREVARFFKTDLDPIQKQLDRLERGGVLYSRQVGKTRLFGFNPRYPFLSELKCLLDKALQFYPPADRERIVVTRRRPRRKGKPL